MGTIERRGLVDTCGNCLFFDPHGSQEQPKCLGRSDRIARTVPPKIQIEVAVGKALGRQMSGMDGQGSLTDTAHPGDGSYSYCARCAIGNSQ